MGVGVGVFFNCLSYFDQKILFLTSPVVSVRFGGGFEGNGRKRVVAEIMKLKKNENGKDAVRHMHAIIPIITPTFVFV